MRIMRLNKILIVGCLMLGFPASCLSAPFNPDDLFKVDQKPSADAAGAFARTAAQINDTVQASEARKYLAIANSKIAQDPNNALYYYGRAEIYRDLHEYQSSLVDLDRAIKLNPSNQSYYSLRATVWSRLGNYANEVRDIDRAIEIGPAGAELYRRRAAVLQLLRRYDESLVAANRSVSMDPKASDSYVIRGITKFFLRDYSGAELDCKKAESLDPANTSMTKPLRHLLDKRNL